MLTATAIITARGGSKGLPGKNLRLLRGHPLIAFTIEAALGSRFVDRCIVSTEDEAIRRESLSYGAEVLDRPADLAQDSSRSADVIRHVLTVLQAQNALPHHFVLLQPVSPLRHAGHIDACLQAYFESGAACAISVCPVEHHPYKMFTLANGLLEPLVDECYLDQPRQELAMVYRQNGAIYAMPCKTFLEANRFFIRPVMPFLMSEQESVDIDTLADLDAAELALTRFPPPRWPRKQS